MNGERFVAIGDSVGDVLSRDDVEVVELRPTFVIVKATKAAAAEIRQRCGGFVILRRERAALTVIDLFDHAAPRSRTNQVPDARPPGGRCAGDGSSRPVGSPPASARLANLHKPALGLQLAPLPLRERSIHKQRNRFVALLSVKLCQVTREFGHLGQTDTRFAAGHALAGSVWRRTMDGCTGVRRPARGGAPMSIIITARFRDLSVRVIAPVPIAVERAREPRLLGWDVQMNYEAGDPVAWSKRTVHYVGGLGVRAGHWAHAEPAPHATPKI